MEYIQDVVSYSMMVVMYNMGDVEYEGLWGCCWFDLGISDVLVIDILVNSFK